MVDTWTGVDNSVDKITTTVTKAAGAIKDYTTETLKGAKAIVELRNQSELAAVQVQGLIEDYDRQAEKLRQVRDDESKTFEERIAANNKLGEVLKEQEKETIDNLFEKRKKLRIRVKDEMTERERQQLLADMGPQHLEDKWGMGLAVVLLERSKDKGRNDDTN